MVLMVTVKEQQAEMCVLMYMYIIRFRLKFTLIIEGKINTDKLLIYFKIFQWAIRQGLIE